VTILVIPNKIEKSYLQSGEGYSQISATIYAPEDNYAYEAVFCLVNGELHIFGGDSDGNKIARLDGCLFIELPARLNESRQYGHAALSIEDGKKALVCFGNTPKCEIYNGLFTATTYAAEWTHRNGALGLYKNQAATVGCSHAEHQKAETFSDDGWVPLPDHPMKISQHSLVGLDNGAMLLLGGKDRGSAVQTGIWRLKEERWSRIGELSKPAYSGSAIYVSRSVYYFEYNFSAIHRVDMDDNEELEAVEGIGTQPSKYRVPVLFLTDNGYCT